MPGVRGTVFFLGSQSVQVVRWAAFVALKNTW